MSAVDLLPCPFCGGEAEMLHLGPVKCKSCGVLGRDSAGLALSAYEPAAAAAWNRRAPVSAGKVKALVWVADPFNEGDYQFWRARAGDYLYEVGCNLTYWWQEDGAANLCATEGFADAAAAKAAAQADYEARILAQLQPGDGWQRIGDAPDFERVIVARWQPRSGSVAGYWWYYEDQTDEDGRPIDHPDATHFVRMRDVLPAFPAPPVSLPQGEETR